MCSMFGSDNSDELAAAKSAAQLAQQRANQALIGAQRATEQARRASTPAADQEAAQRAAENVMRKRVAEGTYTRSFGTGTAGVTPPAASIGYRLLTAA